MPQLDMRRFGVALALAFTAMLPGTPVDAQQSQAYTISGTVIDGNTQRGLAAVAVTVRGTPYGTLTDGAGRYALQARLNPGTHTLGFSLIGRGEAVQQVTVGANANVTVPPVSLQEVALSLESIVVTGTGAPTQQRALGNTVAVVGGSQITEAKAVTVDQALAGKIAGAQVMANSGTPGGGVSVRLRGTSSITGGAEPLYIVDGVILDNSSDQSVNFGYRSNPSNRIADLNPNDIERVEVLKGASAAALYGSRANNGVIQIFTKRGGGGEPIITAETRATLGQLPKKIHFNMAPVDASGAAIQRYDHQDLIFDDSWSNDSYVSVSGGANETRYFLSAGHTRDEGIMIGSDHERTSVRMNLDQAIGDWLTLAGGANYTDSHTSLLINGENGAGGILTSIVFTPTNIDLAAKDPVSGQYVTRAATFPNPLEVIDNWETPQDVSRFVGSFNARVAPIAAATIDWRLGYDTYNQQTRQYVPRGTPSVLLGSSRVVDRQQALINNDLVGNLVWGRGEALGMTTTLGMNHTYTNEETIDASASDLVPVSQLVRGAVQNASQSKFETATFGVFGQQQIAFNNRLFLTGALRMDASSTFGEDERWQMYPKLSGSWVVSEESFFSGSSLGGFFDELRLRAALGYAGNQPSVASAYARFPRYTLSINQTRSGLVHLANPGNPNLKPERQREIEGGFDASILNDRLGIAFTYYNQYVTDLLLTRPFAPSTGYGSILDNVGELSNKGVELQLTGRIANSDRFGWTSTMNFSANRNKVEKLNSAPFLVGYVNRVEEGKPLGVFWDRGYERDENGEIVLNADGNPIVARNVFWKDGDPNPDWQASLNNEFRLGQNLRLNFLLDGVFGHAMWNQTRRIMDIFGAGPLSEQQLTGEITAARKTALQNVWESYSEDASFIKLRELTLQYDLASYASRMGLRGLSVEVGGRNLHTWTDYSGYDPETNMFGTLTVERGTDFAVYPTPRRFTFGVRASY